MRKIKYILITFLFFQVTVFAVENNLSENNTQYKNAIEQFKAKNYTDAFSLFGALVKEYPQDEKVNFYYARSAYELKNYETAFMAYDKILINNPMNHRARLEYARTLLMLESYENAKIEFEKVLSSPIPKQVRTNVEKFLKIIENKQKKYIMTNIAIFGFGWDNNVDNATYEYNNNLINGLTNSNTDKKKDYSFKSIFINNLTVPFKSYQNLAWDNTILAYIQKQYNANDLFLISIASGITSVGKNYKNTTSLLFDAIWLDGDKSIYLYGIKNSLKYKIDNDQNIGIDISYKKKKYFKQSDQAKNSNSKKLYIDYSLLLDKNSKVINSIGAEIVRKEQGTRTDISKNVYTYKISYEQKFLDTYSYNLSYNFNSSYYQIPSVAGFTTLPKRKDKEYILKLKVTKNIGKTQKVYIEFANTNHISNNNIYSYDKNKINLNYMIVF